MKEDSRLRKRLCSPAVSLPSIRSIGILFAPRANTAAPFTRKSIVCCPEPSAEASAACVEGSVSFAVTRAMCLKPSRRLVVATGPASGAKVAVIL